MFQRLTWWSTTTCHRSHIMGLGALPRERKDPPLLARLLAHLLAMDLLLLPPQMWRRTSTAWAAAHE